MHLARQQVDVVLGHVEARSRRRQPGDSCAGFPGALVADHKAKLTSNVFRAFIKSMGSCLIVASA